MSTALRDQLLDAMRFRCIGPPRGGRVVAVAGCPNNPAKFYFGAVAGGIWATDDAGHTWRNISDGYLNTSSVGALTVSASDPNVIYAGMGESTIRLDVSPGDGVYRSTDGGQSWRHLGLERACHIGEIRVHPSNPDHVYVAALGNAFGRNEQRGVYRSTDGGASWQQVLYKSDKAGAIDLSLDPNNPDVVYATLWEAHRNFWELSSGGPDSGIYVSRDGGDSWQDITRNPGLPATGLIGKVGVSASPAKPGRVFALVESEAEPGLYLSEDFGDTWILATDKQELRYRPWYYMHVFADPLEADTVYVTNLRMWKSTDAGKEFTRIATPHGDNHDLWIDPHNNQRMVQGNDGGANVSFSAGRSWSTIYNQLTAQFYTVTTDNQLPHYRVYGTQQDNSSISVPSNSNNGAILWGDCYSAGTGESGYMAVHPRDSNIVYVGAVGSSPGGGGALQRYDHRTGQVQLVNVWPEAHGGMGADELRYRFPWTFPILFSPHDHDVLYTTGNVVFRSTDEGHSWHPISPDLTRDFKDKLGASGGPITKDTSGAEHYCTIYTFRESPHEPGVFWSGSDDGLVQVSRDNSQSWNDVTPKELPEWSFIRTVEPSPHDAAKVYVAATRYKLDDRAPYVFKSSDYGESWQSIVGSGEHALPADDFVRVVRADPGCPGLLYAGTENALYVSFDDGESWQRWRSNLPITPIYDLKVKGSDLVVATHGRSFWILDDLTPLHQAMTANGPVLYRPRSTWRLLTDIFETITGTDGRDYAIGLGQGANYVSHKTDDGHLEREFFDAGEAAPPGALIYIHLPEAINDEDQATLSIHAADGTSIRSYGVKPKDWESGSDADKAFAPGPWLPVQAGMHRFVWDLRHEAATRLHGNKTGSEANRGPLALPGHYEARLTIAGRTQSQTFEVINDPRSDATFEELESQLTLLLAIRDKLSEVYSCLASLRKVRAQLEHWRHRLADTDIYRDILDSASSLIEALDSVESALVLPGEQKDVFGLHERVRLNEALASVISVIDSADAKPTAQARELAGQYMRSIDTELSKAADLLGSSLTAFNTKVIDAKLPAVVPG
ncbi:MAG: glycosyl hydrolase [Thiotrichales bacterium]|nr:glycosyl hydrolase [Thiotrichales bacterium]